MNEEKLLKRKQKEQERHEKVMKKIKEATSREELPNITESNITSFLATNSKFDKEKLSPSIFKGIMESVCKYNFFVAPEVMELYISILKEHCPGRTEEEYEEKYREIVSIGAVENYIFEMSEKAMKIQEFEDKENLEEHEKIMKQINSAYEIKDLPKVGRGTFNRQVQSDVKNDFTDRIAISNLKKLSDCIFEGKDDDEIEAAIIEICEAQDISDEDKEIMRLQIVSQIFSDKKLQYIKDEVEAKEKRTLKIYEMNHEEVMEQIKDARRISQLPQNLNKSILTSYLSGNTIIYPKAIPISTTELKSLTELLLSGKKFEEDEIQDELKRIAEKAYPENSDEAFELLNKKLSALPRTEYLVEEINYSQERQAEFIGRSCSNVNVYFIPNPNTPIEGGKFYNCYISRAQNLDLEEILPLDLEEIVPEGMDIDAVEWYIQENYDETFKTAGGIILNKDETIGNVNVFKPSDGKVGVTPEEQSKYAKLEELSRKSKDLIKTMREQADRFREAQEAFAKCQEDEMTQLKEIEEQIASVLGEQGVSTDDEAPGSFSHEDDDQK